MRRSGFFFFFFLLFWWYLKRIIGNLILKLTTCFPTGINFSQRKICSCSYWRIYLATLNYSLYTFEYIILTYDSCFDFIIYLKWIMWTIILNGKGSSTLVTCTVPVHCARTITEVEATWGDGSTWKLMNSNTSLRNKPPVQEADHIYISFKPGLLLLLGSDIRSCLCSFVYIKNMLIPGNQKMGNILQSICLWSLSSEC